MIGQKSEKSFLCLLSRKDFVNIFSVFAWEFCIEKWRGFLVNFFWSPFPTKRSTKTPQKFGENSETNSGQNSGQKFEKFGELSFCDFSDLRNRSKSEQIGTNWGIPKTRMLRAQIGTNRKKPGKLEQIGTNWGDPLSADPNGQPASECENFLQIRAANLARIYHIT